MLSKLRPSSALWKREDIWRSRMEAFFEPERIRSSERISFGTRNLNLAPLRYRNILRKDGGPVRLVQEGQEKVCGITQFTASVYLINDLTGHVSDSSGRKHPDGVGSGMRRLDARYKAYSEAIERWALRSTCFDEAVRESYGFDIDPSSTGMGAYPGLFKRSARKAAQREAIERACLVLWWQRMLPCRILSSPCGGLNGIRIENPFSKDWVVVVWEYCDETYYTYGFGSGRTEFDAVLGAATEMGRVKGIVSQHYHKRGLELDLDYVSGLPGVFERRALFFSRPTGGFDQVLERISNAPARRFKKPKKIVDREVVGPWSRYAHVWRILYDMPTNNHLSEDVIDYFYW